MWQRPVECSVITQLTKYKYLLQVYTTFYILLYIFIFTQWNESKIKVHELSSMLKLKFQITSAQAVECCLGDRKNVPSTNGYLSKTSIGARQRTQDTLDHCNAASVDRMKHLVSSLPWLPSSSICNKPKNKSSASRTTVSFDSAHSREEYRERAYSRLNRFHVKGVEEMKA